MARTTPQTIFDLVKEAKTRSKVPIALLTYYNILFRMGVKKFVKQASEHGVDGLIIPDLPIEEAEEYVQIARKEGEDTIFLASPLTSETRLADILSYTKGFLYLVSAFGVTGTRERVTKLTIDTIRKVHLHTVGTIPLAVGFGISKTEHVKTILSCRAEGAIVGSAFVRIVQDNLGRLEGMIQNISELTRELKASTLCSA
jgi:tryptophan synthase alpha chain